MAEKRARAANRLLSSDGTHGVYEVTHPVYRDFQRLADFADVVFVADLVGLRPNVAEDGPHEEDPNAAVIEQAGLVFDVRDRLKGNVGWASSTHRDTRGPETRLGLVALRPGTAFTGRWATARR